MLVAGFASAATLTGTVKNLTTGKAAAGDEVALLALSQGMTELAHTKTDTNGAFTFKIDDASTPHLVRVTHDGVNYFPPGGPVRPGMTTVEIPVYDGAKKLDGVSTTVNVMRIQADGGKLQILQLIAVNNASQPPKALSGNHTYEFYLPQGAQLDQMMAQAPGGMPVNVAPVPEGSGKYHVGYAMKPGETRLEIAYHLPYSGEASFMPKMTDKIQHFVVMMPNSITFSPADPGKFAPMENKSANVLVATNVNSSTDLSFKISGTGILRDVQPGGDQAQSGESSRPTAADNHPGGGLGPPTDAPDPLHSYRWFVLAGLGVVLLCGAVFVVNRPGQLHAGTSTLSAKVVPNVTVNSKAAAPVVSAVGPPQPLDKAAMLLEGLKDELFQLEVEKQQGRISDDEYQQAKAALDQTLKRALVRMA